MQAIYCVNAPRVFSLTYNAVKPLMKEEFRRKVSQTRLVHIGGELLHYFYPSLAY